MAQRDPGLGLPRANLRAPRSPSQPSRRSVIAGGLGAAALAALAACSAPPSTLAGRARLSVGVGFEDVASRKRGHAARLESHLDEVGVDAVSIAVGRLDWLAFSAAGRRGDSTPLVRETGRDLVREAIDAWGHGRRSDGSQGDRTVTLVLDALAPRLLAKRPELRGVRPDGTVVPDFPGVAAWQGGTGDDLARLAGEVAQRYRPQRIGLTELMFDDATFSDADLASYRRATGRDDWPRRRDGSIATDDPSLGRWRSDALAGVVSRVAREAGRHGAAVDMDVRAARGGDPAGRLESGHDYAQLLGAADRLVVWNYFGLDGGGARSGAALTRALRSAYGDRFVVSTGLWAQNDAVLDPAAMVDGVHQCVDAGAPEVAVTPASLMSGEHWRRLAAWAR